MLALNSTDQPLEFNGNIFFLIIIIIIYSNQHLHWAINVNEWHNYNLYNGNNEDSCECDDVIPTNFTVFCFASVFILQILAMA